MIYYYNFDFFLIFPFIVLFFILSRIFFLILSRSGRRPKKEKTQYENGGEKRKSAPVKDEIGFEIPTLKHAPRNTPKGKGAANSIYKEKKKKPRLETDGQSALSPLVPSGQTVDHSLNKPFSSNSQPLFSRETIRQAFIVSLIFSSPKAREKYR